MVKTRTEIAYQSKFSIEKFKSLVVIGKILAWACKRRNVQEVVIKRPLGMIMIKVPSVESLISLRNDLEVAITCSPECLRPAFLVNLNIAYCTSLYVTMPQQIAKTLNSETQKYGVRTCLRHEGRSCTLQTPQMEQRSKS